MHTASLRIVSLLPHLRCYLLPLSLWLLALPGNARSQEWKQVIERDGVRVESRQVAASDVKEVRATAILDLPAARILGVLADVDAYPELMPPTETARLLKRDGTTAWYYMVIHPAWISRRDYCIRLHVTRTPDGQAKSEWAMTQEGCPPPLPGLVRMHRNEGRWSLTPLPGGVATQVVYQALIEPGGSLPTWIVNRAGPRTMPDIFRALHHAAALPRYALCMTDPSRCLRAQ